VERRPDRPRRGRAQEGRRGAAGVGVVLPLPGREPAAEHLPQGLRGPVHLLQPAVLRHAGPAEGAILGKTDGDFFPAELAEKYRRDDAAILRDGTGLEAVEEHVTPDGQTRYVHVIKAPLHDPEGAIVGTQGIFWDVTASKQAEAQLRVQNVLLQEMARSERQAHEALKQAQSRMVQTAKLAGLGQMIAGVAHEINNPLSFVSNNVAVLQRDVGELRQLVLLYRQADDLLARERPELHGQARDLYERTDMDYTLENFDGLMHRTREGLRRIQQIVKDLRVFARLDESELNVVDLNEGIESTANIILGYAKKNRVQLVTELGPLPAVTCFAAKINQVVMNLLSNAIDACDEGGTVTIRTGAEPGGVRIEVADTGGGIPPAVRERIFDPFFTTKPIGVGTGLGLSISYGIVQDHGGKIEVESEPGQGSCFTVHLPLEPDLRRADHRAARPAPELLGKNDA
jgi:PAS domain S-box-containing protein